MVWLAPGIAGESRPLVVGNVKGFSEQLGNLAGGTTLSGLKLSDGNFRAANTLGQLPLGEIQLFAPSS
jgi:hypothetical protein